MFDNVSAINVIPMMMDAGSKATISPEKNRAGLDMFSSLAMINVSIARPVLIKLCTNTAIKGLVLPDTR
jgi:hypothetical protein